MLEAMAQAELQVRADARGAAPSVLDPAVRKQALAALKEAMPADRRGDVAAALRLDGSHAGFCPAFRTLLETARALPDASRGPALRALFIGG